MQVRYIYDTVVAALRVNSQRKFVFVETAFFMRWWREQTPETQEATRALFAKGQLEFINGGWCMADDASPNTDAIIDQVAMEGLTHALAICHSLSSNSLQNRSSCICIHTKLARSHAAITTTCHRVDLSRPPLHRGHAWRPARPQVRMAHRSVRTVGELLGIF